MKGISTIIATILFVIITISLVAVAYLFIVGLLTRSISKTISLVHAKGYMAIIRNDGTDIIKTNDIKVIVNGKQVNIIDLQDVEPRGIVTLKFIPPDFGNELKSAKVTLVGPSNSLSYTTDIIPHESKVVAGTAGLWHFNEGSGYNFTADSSGNIDSGYYNHGYMGLSQDPSNPDDHDPSWDVGKFGSALKFDGWNSSVSVYETSSLRIYNNITVEAWVKSDSSQTPMAIADRYDDWIYYGGWKFYLIDGKISLHLVKRNGNATVSYIGEEAEGFTDLRDGSWHHVLGTYDGSMIKVYVDGKLEDFISYSDDINAGFSLGMSEYATRIGHYCAVCGGPSGHHFNGIIDELRILNTSITQEKILREIYGY